VQAVRVSRSSASINIGVFFIIVFLF